MDFALLVIHGFVGLALAAHGTQRWFGWFGGGGIDGTAAYMESVGLRAPRLMALAAGGTELGGGLLLALGLATPLAAVAIAATMLVASRTDHLGKGWWNYAGGSELPVTNAVVVLALAFGGPGRWSLDAALGLDLAGPAWGVAATLLALAGGLGVVAAFRRRPVAVPVAG